MTSFLVAAAALTAACLFLLLWRRARPAHDPQVPERSRRLDATLALIVVAIAGAGYAWVGSPRLLAVTPDALREGAPTTEAAAAVDAIADQLREQAQARPEDAMAQYQWARAELDRGRPQAAAAGYRRAIALRPKDADLLADGADVVAMAAGGKLSGEPMQFVDRALAIAPDNLKALALKGSEAALRRDFPAALAAWDHALKVAQPGDPIAAYLTRQERAVRELTGEAQPASAADAAVPAATDKATAASAAGR